MFPSILTSLRPPARRHLSVKTLTKVTILCLPLATVPIVRSYRSRFIMTSAAVPDKYRSPPQVPPIFTHSKESAVVETKEAIAAQRAVLDKIAASVTPETATFDNVMEVIARDDDNASLKLRSIGFYQFVSGDADLRGASSECEQLMEDFAIESMMREDIFKLVDALYQKRDSLSLDPESLRLLEKTRKSYISNGLGLPAGPKRDRFKEIKTRLSNLSIEYAKNLTEEDECIWLTSEELKGVPDDIVSNLDKGTGENEGKLRLTFKYPHLFPTMKFALNPETRRRVMIANENKCSQNSPLFKEAIVLRDEAARLLGFDSHAALIIDDKMAKTTANVNPFLDNLRSRLTAGGQKEMEHLLELKNNDCKERGIPSDGNYYLWDHRFYDRLMVEKEYSIDENKIAEYFPLDTTVSRMLKIFEELMGFVFVQLDAEERAKLSPTGKAEDTFWHKDTTMFSVWNDESEGDGFVGYFYLDMHPRQGKYSHFANFNVQPGFTLKNGTRRHPATALVCNFTKPTSDKPSLLKHDEVVTLFHELGHGIHDLAGHCLYSTYHGTSTVRDFVEAPSQMLENWCWTPSVLKSLSRHYKTDENIPEDLIEKLISTKHVNSALFNLRQLHFGIFDMTCHAPKDHAGAETLDPSVLFNKLRAEISPIKGPETQGENYNWGRGDAAFGHMMGGYDAGYYGYLYSSVYSTDMYQSIFKKNPMDGKEGRRYRHTVLEYGGSRDEMESLKEFLGREPSSEAFYKELGL